VQTFATALETHCHNWILAKRQSLRIWVPPLQGNRADRSALIQGLEISLRLLFWA
jgi:hypothetical protein